MRTIVAACLLSLIATASFAAKGWLYVDAYPFVWSADSGTWHWCHDAEGTVVDVTEGTLESLSDCGPWIFADLYPWVWSSGLSRWLWGLDPDQWMTDLGGGLTARMGESIRPGFVLVPAGTFTMGSPPDEPGRNYDPFETQREVTLTRDYLMGRTEVTWAQWNEVRDWALQHGYTDLPPGRNGLEGDGSGTHPVTEVSWYDAVKWLNAWSEKDGLSPCYRLKNDTPYRRVYRTGEAELVCDFNANGYRLPTEAEWERACRAGTTTAFYSGPLVHVGRDPLDPNLDRIGWYAGNSGGNTHPVGLKEPNAYGLYDVSGNVAEWCWDRKSPHAEDSAIDPTGPASGSTRVAKGGGGTAHRKYAGLQCAVLRRPRVASHFSASAPRAWRTQRGRRGCWKSRVTWISGM